MIIDENLKNKYYKALLEKDSSFDGIFFVGVKSTGIFCHPTCPARKPKYENCNFYEHAEEALLSGFRPCKICHPLSYPQEISPLVKKMVALVEENPDKRWKDKDFQELGVHSMTARRQFQRYFGMTFVQYARARRMGIALSSIRLGEKIIDAQYNAGFNSSSGFHDAFSKIMDNPIGNKKDLKTLVADWIDTPLGPMMSIADDEYLYLLEFVDRRGLEREIERLRKRLTAPIIPGKTKISEQIKKELNLYFKQELSEFATPIYLLGSDFQKQVWQTLQKIPLGKTSSYKEMAENLKNPQASRAIGNANGANQLAIIIPCHRVIREDGTLGGYGGGIERKHWLLDHEKAFIQ